VSGIEAHLRQRLVVQTNHLEAQVAVVRSGGGGSVGGGDGGGGSVSDGNGGGYGGVKAGGT